MEKSPIEGYKNITPIVTGKKGFAEVYSAERIDIPGSRVVIKLFKELQKEENAKEYNECKQKEINDEAYVLKKLSGEPIKGVVKYVDNGTCQFGSEKAYFLVQEYLSGGTLFDFLRIFDNQKKRVPDGISCHIFKELVLTVEKIHNKGFAHLDIKLENAMFDADTNVTLIDFGHATELKGIKGSGLLGSRYGTKGYSSPETMACVDPVRKEKDHCLPPPKPFFAIPSDIFSLSVLLYVLIFQDFPFRRMNLNEFEYKTFHDEDHSKFWEQKEWEYNCPIDKDLKYLLTGMLLHQPSVRFTIPDILCCPWVRKNEMNEDVARKYIKEVLYTKLA